MTNFIDNGGVWESNPPTGGLTRSTELKSRDHARRLTQQSLCVQGVFGIPRMCPPFPRRCCRWCWATAAAVSGPSSPTSRAASASRHVRRCAPAGPNLERTGEAAPPCPRRGPAASALSPVFAVTNARAVPARTRQKAHVVSGYRRDRCAGCGMRYAPTGRTPFTQVMMTHVLLEASTMPGDQE
jgi:hypothetical protein